jgi:hypothetical protein
MLRDVASGRNPQAGGYHSLTRKVARCRRKILAEGKSITHKDILARGMSVLRSEPLLFERLLFSCAIYFVILMSPMRCQAADVVFMRSAGGPSPEQQELEVASRFYGLDLKVITATAATDNNDLALSAAIGRSETLAVVIAANTLSQVTENKLLRTLQKRQGGGVPLLILGLTPDTDPELLKTWSGGAAVGCKRFDNPNHLYYAIGGVAGLTGQLTGLDLQSPSKQPFYFDLAGHSEALQVIKARDDHQAVPVFIEASLDRQKVFLDCTRHPASESLAESDDKGNDKGLGRPFAEIAPAMMFIKYSAGEHAWHALHHYANLTIDDPSLREPYGLLDYHGLLGEMEKHNFHSTIAFIPWNYDRSEPEIVSLIRNHPERFSISIHGDNHDHKEFTDYRSKPLDVQVAALRQSLARMDRFQALTKIPYDKVMVFPHSIAPEETLNALKNNDYLATVNSTNIPMGSVRPPGVLFSIRPVTLSFGGFPSILRYSVAPPNPNYLIALHELIAIHAFLDNPLFFYCHHQFFEGGMGAFDDVADRVNGLEPDTRWRGLGDIVRHFYLVKLRDASSYDVLAFSASIDLENTSGRDSVFHVRKMEGDHPAIASVVVDGRAWPFQLDDGYLHFDLPIPAGRASAVTIQYQNQSPLPPVGIEKTSIRVYLLRMASDFRDNILYRSAAGRVLIHSYYGDDGEPRPAWVFECALALMLSVVFVGWRMRMLIRKRHLASLHTAI